MDELTIKKKIVDQLMWDDRLHGSDIKVEIQNGIVRLTGKVNSYFAKNIAEADTLQVNGVVAVKNEILVKHEIDIPPDEEVRERIKETFYWNNNIDYSKLDIRVNNHAVTLLGSVDAYWKVKWCEELIYSIKGVSQVFNKLTVVPTHDLKDELIADSIMKAMERASTVEEEKLTVKVNKGMVTLEGNVDNWQERRAAYQAVLYTKGVKNIMDNLTVVTEYSK